MAKNAGEVVATELLKHESAHHKWCTPLETDVISIPSCNSQMKLVIAFHLFAILIPGAAAEACCAGHDWARKCLRLVAAAVH